MDKVLIYTDGACRNNQEKDNIGAYGAVLIYNNYVKKIKNAYRNVTNNQMELKAVITALQAMKRYDMPVEIYSDSQYVVNTINLGWRRNANQDLWSELDEIKSRFQNISFIKVKGHSSDIYNEMADKLCNEAMDELEKK